MFDPPHIGHVVLAGEARWQLDLDEVRLVVAARPPHRPDAWLPPEERLALVQRAIAGIAGLCASREEIDRPGAGFTVDTVEAFVAAEPDATFWVIVGADQMIAFESWRAPERIVALARLAVVARGGSDTAEAEAVAARLAPGRVDWVRMPTVAVSSSLVRERIAKGEPVAHLLPSGVADMLVPGRFADPAGHGTLKEPSRTT